MKSAKAPARRRRGFTLPELLVVIGIIGLLMALIMPVFSRARRSAREASCMSQVRQLAQECLRYKNDWRIHPPWLSALYPEYLTDKRLLLCPGDFSSPKGSQGGRPDGFPHPLGAEPGLLRGVVVCFGLSLHKTGSTSRRTPVCGCGIEHCPEFDFAL